MSDRELSEGLALWVSNISPRLRYGMINLQT